ncbi:MAG: PAS domain-containing sensor histidine kinase [Pseudomonadales bacterium]|nr:PAS domain-containing sensor histidine kinase [Pseudomonadales bacterium]MCP5185200.1 PAS domain-containing sensor histidine kinase [Pseudomonadales bacterium]
MAAPVAFSRDPHELVEQRRYHQTLALLRIYNLYRVIVGLALLLIFTQNWLRTELGKAAPELFLWALGLYIAFNLGLIVLTSVLGNRIVGQRYFTAAVVTTDIVWLAMLMALSAGVGSGLDGFMLVTVTAGAIVVSGRTSLLTAALATIAVLYQELYSALHAPSEPNDFFQAGVLGILFFASTLVIQNVTRRLRQNELNNLAQAAELADLERVNQLVIQRMQTGILVVDEHNHIRTSNQSARRLLGLSADSEPVSLPEPILSALVDWRRGSGRGLPDVQLDRSGPNVRISFAAVRLDDLHGFATIFLEDNGEIQQQAQQLKLSELGRLSASIAHEIRNPLSAISHAAQLLQESRNLDKGDERLTTIIHNHTKRMNAVVENVLQLSRRQPADPERISLRELVEGFVSEYMETESDVELTVRIVPEDTQVRVDTRQIRQVLTNLVTNAIRHGGAERTRVLLEGGIDAQTDRPYLNVVDNGSGVRPQQESQLFEPFHSTGQKGTGLGLYLSREICAANQARLVYSRDVGGGACFCIHFPHPNRMT